MPLTDTAIRNAKAQKTVHKLSDGGGLQLWISPNGSKLWCLAYRFAEKQKKLSIGAYPAISLSAARDERDASKSLLASGIDPGQQKRINQLALAADRANTFELIAAELLAKKRREGMRARYRGRLILPF